MVRLERVAGNTTLIDYSRNTSGPAILTSYNVRQGTECPRSMDPYSG